MAERRNERRHRGESVLRVRDLHVFYGHSHALQGVDLTLDQGVHAVVGRNGMGKTTLCNAVMGLLPAQRGSIRFHGEEINRLPTHRIASKGIGYTPQGRRLWPSLSVDEHLQLAATEGAWTVDRVYETFPRLFDRRQSGAGQLSGGEQQMLAISRSLLQNPELLVLDEPTEGLAPVIVDQVEELLAQLVEGREVAILLIEQNIAVATAISTDVAIMVNGRISQIMPAATLAGDRMLQERLLGVGRHSHEGSEQEIAVPLPPPEPSREPADDATTSPTTGSEARASARSDGPRGVYVPPTRWSAAAWQGSPPEDAIPRAPHGDKPIRPFDFEPKPLFRGAARPRVPRGDGAVYLAGTFDTKGPELNYIKRKLTENGLRVLSVDLSTSGKPSSADFPPHVVAAFGQGGSSTLFSNDRGEAVKGMAGAFERWIVGRDDIAGVISAGGSGGTSLVTPAMRRLPVGVPKVMISTVASGDVGQYVGPSDIMMMYSVTDVQGLNRISRQVLSNGANALAGMVKRLAAEPADKSPNEDKPALGLTMFGVTTTAVQQIVQRLENRYDCLVFHATGTGGRSMEKLADSGLLTAAIDLTTTEVCDLMMGGVFAATEDRFGAFIRTRLPYVGSVGALDMVNFGPRATVPERYARRLFVEHNPQVTLMRTTPEENARMGVWIADRLNQMTGPVRFLLPESGVSALDAPGQPFHDPAADRALFEAIETRFRESGNRRLVKVAHHINDPDFAQAAVDALLEIGPTGRSLRYATI